MGKNSMKIGLFININAISIILMLSVIMRLFITITGGAIIVGLIWVMYSLRKIFIVREQKIKLKMRRFLYAIIIIIYISLAIMYYVHYTSRIEILDWSTFANILLYLFLIHTYYTCLFYTEEEKGIKMKDEGSIK